MPEKKEVTAKVEYCAPDHQDESRPRATNAPAPPPRPSPTRTTPQRTSATDPLFEVVASCCPPPPIPERALNILHTSPSKHSSQPVGSADRPTRANLHARMHSPGAAKARKRDQADLHDRLGVPGAQAAAHGHRRQIGDHNVGHLGGGDKGPVEEG